MDCYARGWIPIAVTAAKPSKDKPKGGVYDRLEKLLLTGKEKWNAPVERLLDFRDLHPDLWDEFIRVSVLNGK